MTEALKIMLENIEQRSTKEKALAAHCLLTTIDTQIDRNLEAEWLKLAESRMLNLSQEVLKVYLGQK